MYIIERSNFLLDLFYYLDMNMTESLLDTEQDIRHRIDDVKTEIKKKITIWMTNNAWCYDLKSVFRKISVFDFSIDDKLLISINRRKISEISLLNCEDIPEYIRFADIGKELKIIKCGCKGDISFVYKDLTKYCRDGITYITITDNPNITSIGDLSKFHTIYTCIAKNPKLTTSLKQLPSSVIFTYIENKNKFTPEEIDKELKDPFSLELDGFLRGKEKSYNDR